MRAKKPYRGATTMKRSMQPLPDQAKFMADRIEPLLHDCARYPLRHLLAEAYYQGFRDAVEVMPADMKGGAA